jgi:tetratricopeptide (TPR) repeat protein
MIDVSSNDALLDDLAEEFARRCRDGEQPSVEDYATRYLRWADDIRAMFPAVLLMEQLKPRCQEPSTASQSHEQTSVPERIGEFRIIREIGRGGMGVVYEAYQETLQRQVALKVLPAHLFANERLRARFQRESHAAARLHHTNIVPVLGVGEQDGLCYYVMQLIAGDSLDSEAHQSLSQRTVAGIGAQVADALAYAHGQGVLHRDIKPSNLLLDERGTVWVTDFGVAKLVEEANLTLSGDLVGTLRYVPPERFLGQSDVRGDVYSLGITLYELLSGRPAFPETTPHHLIQLITEGNPEALRKLDATVLIDLETIIRKAISRDPAHRYQSASELSEDLQRFLNDQPVRARRISSVGHAWRWCRRNRVVAVLAGTAVGLLAITAVVAIAAYLRTSAANREASAANGELTKAFAAEQAQRERAEKTSASALEAMNRIYDRFAPNRILVTPPLPAESSSEEGVELPPQPVLSPEAIPLLEELLGFYEQVAREGGDYPNLQLQAAEANQRIGDIRQRLGQMESAISAYRKGLELYARRGADAPDAVCIKVARTNNELGRALRTLQKTDEAREAHSQALAILREAPGDLVTRPEYRYELARTYYFQSQREQIGGPPEPGPGGPGVDKPHGPGHPPPDERSRPHGPDDPGRPPPPDRGGPPPVPPGAANASRLAIGLLKDLVKEHPKVPEYRHLLACCYRDGQERALANSGLESAIELLRQLVSELPQVPDYRYDLCETLARAAFSGYQPGSDAAADAQLKQAFMLSDDLVSRYPSVPLYKALHSLVLERQSFLLFRMNKRDESEKTLRKAVGLHADLVRQHPEVVAYNVTYAMFQSILAHKLCDRDEWKEARSLLESATERLETILKKDPRLRSAQGCLGRSERDLAQVLTQLGEPELAARALKKAEEFGPDKRFGPQGPGRDLGDPHRR